MFDLEKLDRFDQGLATFPVDAKAPPAPAHDAEEPRREGGGE